MAANRRIGQCTLFLFLIALVGCGRKEAAEPIWFGQVAALTGRDQPVGLQARQGVLLAVEEANGGEEQVVGRKVAVDHADTRSKPDMARPVLMRLLEVNRVKGVLGGGALARIDQVAALGRAHGVPIIIGAGTDQPAVAGTSEFVFYSGLSPRWQAQALARFAQEQLKVAQVAILCDEDPRYAARADAFAKELPRFGRWNFAGADKLKTAYTEIKERKSIPLVYAGAADLLAELGPALDPRSPILFLGEEVTAKSFQGIPETVTIYLATAFAEDGQSAREFGQKYRDKFGETPEAPATLAYDDARMLFEATRRAKSFDGTKIRDALRELQFDGVTGAVSFDAQHTLRRPAFLVQMKAGAARFEKRYDPPEKD